jgi:ParB family chromosome partitioning protein
MNQATKPAPLGRGLSALFGDKDVSYQPKPVVEPGEKISGARKLPVAWLQPGLYQPRHAFNDDQMKELTESIRVHGILQPLLVRPAANATDVYEIVAGERRWRAAQLAGLHEVPVVVRELSDREALEFGLIENIQRQDLSPLEEAEGYQKLIANFQHTQEGLGKIIGKSRSHIANMIRLLTLPPSVKQYINEGLLSAGHARALVTAKNHQELAEEIIKKGLNVRQAEALVREAAENPQRWGKKKPKPQDANIAAFEKDLMNATGLKVTVVARGAGAGAVTLHYQNLEQLDAITKKLKG